MAASTGPFALTAWLLMLGAYSFARVSVGSMGPPEIPRAIPEAAAHVAITPAFLCATLFRNISQVFLVKSAIAGLLFVVGIAVSSIRAAIFAVLGSAMAMATALLFGADGADIAKGLYGFSPVLTAIALGCVFLRPSWKVILYALLGTVFTVIVQGGMDVLVAPLGIPTFTMPYVVTMWLFTLPKASLQPPPHHEPVKGDIHPALSKRALEELERQHGTAAEGVGGPPAT